MGWILCKDSENKVFYENPGSGEMTRKRPRDFFNDDEEKFHLKDDLKIKRLRLNNEIEEMKKELAELDAQIALQSNSSSEETSLVLNEPASKSKEYNGKIEEQPTEILVHILKQMFDLKSITKCFNTNSRWRKIVEETFKNTGKVACLFMFLKDHFTNSNMFPIIF